MNANTQVKLPFFTLLLMISFASVNAVLFTPALPNIQQYFSISTDQAQYTMTFFLLGYALGQLMYGPLANRFGRKPALYIGITIQIVSSLLCVFSGMIHEYSLLVISRFLLAIGSAVGLKMTITLVNECYEPRIASQKLSYLMLAFAITPSLSVAIGGILTEHFDWVSCFYASAIYGTILLLLITRFPETQTQLDLNALKINHLMHAYSVQFKNKKLIAGGLLLGFAGSFIYSFAAVAPFVSINILGMSSAQYGIANMLPPIGLILGSLASAQLVKQYSLNKILLSGIIIAGVSVSLIWIAILMDLTALFILFVPMIFIYFGLCFIFANTPILVMSSVADKAHASAAVNFLNMGSITLVVLSLGWLPVNIDLLPSIFVVFALVMIALYRWLTLETIKET